MQIDFLDKNVFVMGGTSGINLGIADAFAEAGARVAVASRNQEKVDAAVARLRRHNGETLGYVADVRDEAAVEAALGGAHDSLGPLDVLVSGAAGNFPAPVLGMSANGFKAVVEIDLQGTFHVLRSACPFFARPVRQLRLRCGDPRGWWMVAGRRQRGQRRDDTVARATRWKLNGGWQRWQTCAAN